jgi:hypothetical protein
MQDAVVHASDAAFRFVKRGGGFDTTEAAELVLGAASGAMAIMRAGSLLRSHRNKRIYKRLKRDR